jgi:hypothetical protein
MSGTHETYCWTCAEALSAPYANALAIELATHLKERHGESADMDEIRRWISDHGSRSGGTDPNMIAARVLAGAVALLFVLIGFATGGIAWFGIAGLALVLMLMTL